MSMYEENMRAAEFAEPSNLMRTIEALERELAELQKRVEALENKAK